MQNLRDETYDTVDSVCRIGVRSQHNLSHQGFNDLLSEGGRIPHLIAVDVIRRFFSEQKITIEISTIGL